ncbi:hypothetical protein BDP55DRAFT_645634 [Colletotrichum godetiae]|uniref:Uncharacterized protein n=1 Tax=Colletotrichum godetiae TaxID=1209918 RepID=A0AAJ0AXC3_9PEZI|nr:uncharacterized protein BDP55DRAFT_645634 [Colletotrichum godetiae]KAK1700007.1 hypothetical protein BDP55DRAFT_645634 [Colletotrichum godetiae]
MLPRRRKESIVQVPCQTRYPLPNLVHPWPYTTCHCCQTLLGHRASPVEP